MRGGEGGGRDVGVTSHMVDNVLSINHRVSFPPLFTEALYEYPRAPQSPPALAGGVNHSLMGRKWGSESGY